MRPYKLQNHALPAILILLTFSWSTTSSQELIESSPAPHPLQNTEAASQESDGSYDSETDPAGRPLTLDAALRLATVRNPALVAKRKELGIAEGELRQAAIYFQNNPEISVGLDRLRVPSPSGSERFTEFEVELSQEFEIFGQPRARRKAADAARETVLADIAATVWEVLSGVRSEFYAAQIALGRLRLAEDQFQFGNAVLELSKRQLDAGDIAPTEYRQLQIQMAELRTKHLSARAELASALDILRLSLGYGSTESIDLVDVLQTPTGLPFSAETFVGMVFDVYPRLRHAGLVMEQREREFTLVKKEGKPNVTGSVFTGREEDDDEFYGIALAVPLPLFNRNQGSRAAAKAAIDVAKAQLRYFENALRTQAQTAFTRLAISQEAASYYYEGVLPAVQTNIEQLENAFRQGEIGMLELRINQRDLLDAQTAALDALAEYYEQRAQVEGLMGRSLSVNLSTDSQLHEESSDAP